jgi:phage terminase large subunit-like protein
VIVAWFWLAVAVVVTFIVLLGLGLGRASARADQAAPALLPRRDPGAAKGALDAAEARHAHVDAVWAQCRDSGPYVAAMLAAHEPEVTHLLELALELDDQRPPGSGGERRGFVAE